MVFVGNNSPMHADFCIRVNCNHGDFKHSMKKNGRGRGRGLNKMHYWEIYLDFLKLNEGVKGNVLLGHSLN